MWKKTVSALLAVMMVAVTAITTSAATGSVSTKTTINGQEVHTGDQIVFTSTIKNADKLSAGTSLVTYYNGSVLKISDETRSIDKENGDSKTVFPTYCQHGSLVWNLDPPAVTVNKENYNTIRYCSVDYAHPYDFTGDGQISAIFKFDVIAEPGTATLLYSEMLENLTSGIANVTSDLSEKTEVIHNSTTTYPEAAASDFNYVTLSNGTLGLTKYVGNGGSFTIPSKIDGKDVTLMDTKLFAGNSSVVAVAIPNSITNVSTYAFYGCSSLEKVILGSGVKSIGKLAFYNCAKLTSVTIPANVTSIASGSFGSSGNAVIYGASGSAAETFAKSSGITFVSTTQPTTETTTEPTSASTAATDPTEAPQSPVAAATDFNYVTLSNGTIGITKYIGTLTDFTIPSTIDGKAVTVMDTKVFAANTNITNVMIPDSITNVSSYAFYGCTSLKSVTLGTGVKSIAKLAFYGCPKLTSVTIPANVTSIATGSFGGSNSVTINGAKGSAAETFANNAGITFNSSTDPTEPTSESTGTTAATEPTSQSDGQVAAESDFSYVTLSNGTIGITKYNGTLTNFTIPSTINGKAITLMDTKIFAGNTNITKVIIPDSITNVSSYAFYGCTSLESVVLGSSVKSIAKLAFYGCPKLTSVTVPANVTSIASGSFGGSNSVTIIGAKGSAAETFAKNAGLAFTSSTDPTQPTTEPTTQSDGQVAAEADFSYVTLSNGTIGITKYNGTLTNFTIPSTINGKAVTVMDTKIFAGNTNITKVIIPSSVTNVSSYAFYGCSSLQTVVLGTGVKSIGKLAFYGCSKLASITIPANVTTITSGSLTKTSSLTIYGKTGSAANTFATNAGITFKAI